MLPTYRMVKNGDKFDVYIYLYGSEIDLHWCASFKWECDAIKFMEEGS